MAPEFGFSSDRHEGIAGNRERVGFIDYSVAMQPVDRPFIVPLDDVDERPYIEDAPPVGDEQPSGRKEHALNHPETREQLAADLVQEQRDHAKQGETQDGSHRPWPEDFADAAALIPRDINPPIDLPGQRLLEELPGKALDAVVWEALYLTLEALTVPFARWIAGTAYEAGKLISGVRGLLDGEGFIYQVAVCPIAPFTFVVLRFPQGSVHGLPPVMLGIDINILQPLKFASPDSDGAAEHPDQVPPKVEPWAGEWTMIYGEAGIHDREDLLGRRCWVFPPV